MHWYLLYSIVWLATALLAALLVRGCIAIAPRLGMVDVPLHEAHKRHGRSTPVMGGAGMLLAWLLAIAGGHLLCAFGASLLCEDMAAHLPGMASALKKLDAIALGAILVTILGMADDKKAMKALPKFIGQGAVALLTAALGLRISFLHAIPGANWVITVLWIMTLMNALNFFDNMDGLAAGCAALAFFFFAFVAALRGQYFVATLAAATCGAATGFLFWNKPQAKIFMGDGGSHFLGYLLAVTGILTTFYVPGESPTPTPILIPLFIVGVPLADAVAVVLIRLHLGVPIYKGDNRHISHRFVALGLSRPQAVLAVLLLCFIVGTASLTLLWLPPAGSILIFALVAAVFAVIAIVQFCVHTENNQ